MLGLLIALDLVNKTSREGQEAQVTSSDPGSNLWPLEILHQTIRIECFSFFLFEGMLLKSVFRQNVYLFFVLQISNVSENDCTPKLFVVSIKVRTCKHCIFYVRWVREVVHTYKWLDCEPKLCYAAALGWKICIYPLYFYPHCFLHS